MPFIWLMVQVVLPKCKIQSDGYDRLHLAFMLSQPFLHLAQDITLLQKISHYYIVSCFFAFPVLMITISRCF